MAPPIMQMRNKFNKGLESIELALTAMTETTEKVMSEFGTLTMEFEKQKNQIAQLVEEIAQLKSEKKTRKNQTIQQAESQSETVESAFQQT